MSNKFHYLHSENNFYGDKNMAIKDFENRKISKSRKKNKKHKNVFAELKNLKKEE